MKTVILGNSLEVFPVIENMLSQDQNTDVSLLASEGVLPYDRGALPLLAALRIKEQDFFKSSEKFLADHPHVMVSKQPLNRVSLQRRHVTMEDKTQMAFDAMVLFDTGSLILPDIKGRFRRGVFDCWRFASVRAMVRTLIVSEHVMVVATNIQGLNMACALKHLGSDVTVLSSTVGLLPDIFDQETGLLLKQILEAKGIRTLHDASLQEILGDAEVRAVKLTSGKVLACDAVIFDEVKSDTRLFSQQNFDDHHFLSVEKFFSLSRMPFEPTYFGLGLLDGFYGGWTKLPEGGREYLKFDGPKNIYKKMYVVNNTIVGLVIFNAAVDCERLWEMLKRRENVTGHEEAIL